MAAGPQWLCANLLFVMFVSADEKIIPAESGQDVTLTCRAPNKNIYTLEWSRADLGGKNVLFYQKHHFDPANQHPSFKNRVDLKDRQMKDGDVSLILKDVTINDTGRYECHVFMTETRSWEVTSFINLRVVDPPVQRGREERGEHEEKVQGQEEPGQKNITALSGQDVTLTCRAQKKITVLKWSRADLGSEYVLQYHDNQSVPDDQHPSFKNRVDLQDREMKDGDVSLILKDVTTNDTGTYECGVFMEETRSWEVISIIYLTVVDPPGPSGGIIGLIVVVLLFLVGVVFLIYRKHKVSRYSYKVPTENNEAPQSPQQDCVRGQTEVNYPEPPADGH